MLSRITNAVAHPDHTVTITWSDGAQGTVDLTPFIARGGLFAALNDANWFVREMRILPAGIGLAWPNELDFSADGLRQDAFPHEETGEFNPPVAAACVGRQAQVPSVTPSSGGAVAPGSAFPRNPNLDP